MTFGVSGGIGSYTSFTVLTRHDPFGFVVVLVPAEPITFFAVFALVDGSYFFWESRIASMGYAFFLL